MSNQKASLSAIPSILCKKRSNEILQACQCDCACDRSMHSHAERSSAYSSRKRYSIAPITAKTCIRADDSYYAILSPYVHTIPLLNKSALTCLHYFSTPKRLNQFPSDWSTTWGSTIVNSTLQQMISLGLLVAEDKKNTLCVPEDISGTLAAWLHITDRCNLRCAYCYLPHHNTNMSVETGNASIEAIFRSAAMHRYQHVKLKYAGGEPLLRFPFVARMHRYANILATRNGLEFDGVVLTNGTLLTEKIVREMQTLDLRLMISLDNVSPDLIGQRMYPDGSDAARDAMQAIELTLDCGLVPDISITVSGKNVRSLPALLHWILERNLPFSVNFYRKHECCLEPSAGDLELEEEKFITGILEAYRVIESNLPSRSLLASLADLANFATPHVRRCSVGQNYLVFDCDGRVSKCQMQKNKPVTDMHANDPLAAVRRDTSGIRNVTVDEKEGCQTCQWRYWCAGGCPLQAYRLTGRYDIKSANCAIYKALFPEILRLEGLRLLKHTACSPYGA